MLDAEGSRMKLHVDVQADALYLKLTDAKIVETSEVCPGIMFDYDEHGEVVGVEVLGLRVRKTPIDVRSFEFKQS